MPINPQLVKYGLESTAQRMGLPTAKSRGITGVTGQGTTTEFVPTGERPVLPDIPEFEVPEYDETKVAGLAQKIAAPRARRLRETTRAAITRRGPGYENPNVRRMTVRAALQGYGTGLEGIISGARRGAVSEYGQQYGAEVSAAQLNFQTKVSTTMQQYSNLWSEYLKTGTTTTTRPEERGGGIRMDPGYRPPQGLSPVDPNDPGTIGSRPIR